jgi:hypothetical protein
VPVLPAEVSAALHRVLGLAEAEFRGLGRWEHFCWISLAMSCEVNVGRLLAVKKENRHGGSAAV